MKIVSLFAIIAVTHALPAFGDCFGYACRRSGDGASRDALANPSVAQCGDGKCDDEQTPQVGASPTSGFSKKVQGQGQQESAAPGLQPDARGNYNFPRGASDIIFFDAQPKTHLGPDGQQIVVYSFDKGRHSLTVAENREAAFAMDVFIDGEKCQPLPYFRRSRWPQSMQSYHAYTFFSNSQSYEYKVEIQKYIADGVPKYIAFLRKM